MGVYLCGSVTNGGTLTPDQIRERCDQFDAKESDLAGVGLAVINPTKLDPDGLRPWQVAQIPSETARMMRICLATLMTCDVIYLLRGWEHSYFTWIELQAARAAGLAVQTEPGATPWDVCGRCLEVNEQLNLRQDCSECGPVMLCRNCRYPHLIDDGHGEY